MGGFRTYGPTSLGGMMTPAVKWLLISNIGVFLLQTFAMLANPAAADSLNRWFGLVPLAVTHGLRIWQPFTYLFLHGGLLHILLNMFYLWYFGVELERTWGRRRLLAYYFLTGVGAGLINVIVKTILGGPGVMTVTIGASGAVFGILTASAVLFPDRQIGLIFPPVVMPMKVFVLIMGAIAFFGTIGAGGDGVSHLTHLTGMVIGYSYLRRGSYFYRLRNRYSDWQRRRMVRRFEVYKRRQQDQPPSRPDDWVN